MGKHHHGQLGSNHYQRRTVSGVPHTSPSALHLLPPIPKSHETRSHGGGHSSSVKHRGNRAGTPRSMGTRFLLHPIRGAKGLGRMEGDPRPQGSKSVPNLPKIQDANSSFYSGQYSARGLSYIHRSDRSLPARSHTSKSQAFSQIQVFQPSLSVQGPAIRPIVSSKGFHQNPGSSRRTAQVGTSLRLVLLGRYPNPVVLGTERPIGRGTDDQDTPGSWIYDQLPKEPSDPSKPFAPLRRNNRHQPVPSFPVSGASAQHTYDGHQGAQGETCNPAPTVTAVRETDLMYCHSALGQASYETTAVVSTPLPETGCSMFSTEGASPTTDTHVPHLVVVPSIVQRIPVQRTDSGNLDHRRLSVWMGGTSGIPIRPGAVVSTGSQEKYQLVRAQSHTPSTSPFPQEVGGPPRAGSDRQRGGKGPCQQARRHSITDSNVRGPVSGVMGRTESVVPKGGTHLRGGKRPGGFSESIYDRSFGVASTSPSLSGDNSPFWSAQSRPVCIPDKRPASPVSISVPIPGFGGRRRPPQPWPVGLLYAFPPLPLIPAVIRKLLQERAELILVAPYWPRCPWFVDLVNLAVAPPWQIPPERIILMQGAIRHPDPQWLQLAAWHLSASS